MTEYGAVRDPNRCPTHPGALLGEILEGARLPKTAIAKAAGISRQQLYDILAERKPVSAAVAIRLGKLIGNGPDLWIRMQADYDIWRAGREVDTSEIETLQFEDA